MTLNIFDGSFIFQRTLVDPESIKSTPRDFTPANDRAAFQTRRDRDEDNFSSYLKPARKDEKVQTKETPESIDRENFVTQKTAVPVRANVPGAAEISGDVDSAVLLAQLGEDLRALIDELVNRAQDNPEQIVTEVEVPEKMQEVSTLLGFLIKISLEESDQPREGEKISLQDFVQALQDLMKDESLTLLASNFTPEEVTDLQDKLQILSDKIKAEKDVSDEDLSEIDSFAAQVVALVNPRAERQAKQVEQSSANPVPKESALPLPMKQAPEQGIQTQAPVQPGRYDGRYDVAARPVEGETSAASSETKSASTPAPQQSSTAQTQNLTSGEKFLQILQNPSGVVPLAESLVTPQQAGQALQSLPSSSVQSLTSVITQSPAATQAHPATQLVSATIQKALRAGEETNIKLRLDPPDLGKVEVRMSIDKDSAAKIVLTVEKPETFLMLQRDSQTLQQAMSDAGLDMGGDLSFELASEDHDFEGQQQKNSGGQNDDPEIIEETVLDMRIDPVTGTVRYDILV